MNGLWGPAKCSERDFAELVRRSRVHDDLLAALKQLVFDFECKASVALVVDALKEAHAAIAKAEGKA